MIVGSYTLHLYCDFPDDSYEHQGGSSYPGPSFREVVSEETRTKSKRVAKRDGWRFSGDKCLCPYCCAKGRKLSSKP
jgi:hypothetical protein